MVVIRQASFFLLSLSVAAALSAETPRWTRATPSGSQVVALTQSPPSPQTLYSVTADNRLFASTNGGATWSLRVPPLEAGEILREAVADPLDARIVHLRTSAGLWRSFDGGTSWSQIGTSLPAVEAIAIDRSLPGVVWAATASGLYRLVDTDDNWQLAPGTEGRNVTMVAIDPRDPDILYIALRGDPLYSPAGVASSTDHGETWENSSVVPTHLGSYPGQPRFAFDTTHPEITYLYFINGYNSMFRTTDLGNTWTRLVENANIHDLTVLPDGTLVAANDFFGISKSTDQGVTWVPPLPSSTLSSPYDRLSRILASAVAPGALLAAGSAGIWSSSDGGTSWQDASQGILPRETFSVIASPMGAPALTAVAGNSVYRSLDQGTTWERLRTRVQGSQPERLVAVDPRRPRVIYGIGINNTTEVLLKTTTSGQSWSQLPSPFHCPDSSICSIKLTGVALDPRRPSTVYLSGFVVLRGVTQHFLLRSNDGFSNFTLLENPPPLTGLAVDPDRSGIVHGLTCKGLYKSFDAGLSWRTTGRNLPAAACETAIAFDPSDARKIWIGTAGKGVFFSSDGGGTFQAQSRGLETARIDTLLFNPGDSSQIYAGVSGKGVFRWNAAGRRWSRLPNPGLPTTGYNGFVTLDPQHPSVLYATHPVQGIFRLDLEATAP